MSSALAISGVSAVLEYLLTNIYSAAGLNVTVSAKAPDLLQADITSSPDALLVNLFMHQVTFNQGWRNVGQPSVDADGATRLKNPPLALDLHYLLTAYGTDDCEAEALLGYAIQMMHETPMIARSEIPPGLASLPSSNPLSLMLPASGLANQIEMIKITPATLGREELAWLWTALKADYRPTFPFQVSVVLIEAPLTVPSTIPVLTRNINVQAGLLPHLFAVQPPTGHPAPTVGDTVIVTGQSLTGVNQVVLTNQHLSISYPPFATASVTAASAAFVVPVDPVNLPAGIYSLSMLFTDATGNVLPTNSIPLAIAPKIVTTAVTPNALGLLVTVNCTPQVRPNQSASLAMGSTMIPAQTFAASTAVLTFQFPALTAAPYITLLRVDGVESPVTMVTV
jgi:hypothetical protein